MRPITPKKNPVKNDLKLKPEVQKADTMREHIASELEKAELRLQKKYAKTLVAQEEEIRYLREELAKKKDSRVHLVIERKIISPGNSAATLSDAELEKIARGNS